MPAAEEQAWKVGDTALSSVHSELQPGGGWGPTPDSFSYQAFLYHSYLGDLSSRAHLYSAGECSGCFTYIPSLNPHYHPMRQVFFSPHSEEVGLRKV
jgi:hypothetical protein